MPKLTSSIPSTYQALKFLEQNTSFLRSLFVNCNNDVDRMSTLIEPILNAPKRCEVAPYYIQAVSTGHSTFVVTNLAQNQAVQIVDSNSSWLIGRRSNCAIAIADPCISRQHAVISHEAGNNFYITDMGSKNGTKVNQSSLDSLNCCLLRDGDLIQLGAIRVEFFIATYSQPSNQNCEIGLTQIQFP